MQDVHNLAWKLAYVLKGKAGKSLLDTYTFERQPVAGFLMRQAYSRLQKRVLHTTPDEPELPDIVCELGYRYPSGAIHSSTQEAKGTSSNCWISFPPCGPH
jgi:2-polyprenyl-6-methoxyphenol hydroxylase-like FAD-dependent oxidoreductase